MLDSLKNLFSPGEKGPPPAAPPTAPPEELPASGDSLTLPLTQILDRLPSELVSLVINPPDEDEEISFPLEQILPQLARGQVKVSFAEVVAAAPEGIFQEGAEARSELIDLPLALVLPKINPALLKRKPPVKSAPDLSGTDFLGGAAPAVKPAAPLPSTPATPPSVATPAPAPASGTEKIALSIKAVFSALPADAQALLPQGAKTPGDVELPVVRILPQLARGSVKVSLLEITRGVPEGVFSGQPADGDREITLPLSEVLAKAGPLLKRRTPEKQLGGTAPQNYFNKPVASADPAPAGQTTFTPAPPKSSTGDTAFVPKMPAARTAGSTGGAIPTTVSIPLGNLIDSLPEALRAEARSLPDGTRVEFPCEELGHALKTGKVAFGWSRMREWMKPAPTTGGGAGTTMVHLPLKAVVAPFMSAMRQAESAGPAQPGENITGMFINRKSSAPVPAGAATAEPLPARAADTHLGELLGQPDKKSWTPTEIVQRVAALPGVAGAFISLAAGQVAAGCMPDGGAELLAYKVPKLFQSTAEHVQAMNLGPMGHVSFSAEGVAWIVFKVGNIFFTVQGRAGDLLPVSRLQSIAVEIGHQRK